MPGAGPRTTLLLITAFHPYVYEGGERGFLPAELEALAARPELHVCIVPQARSAQRYALPPGIELDDTLAHSLRRWRLVDLLLAWRWPGCIGELRRALRHGGGVGMARVWRWAAAARGTWRWLNGAGRPGAGGGQRAAAATVAYTYWRGGATLAIARWAGQAPRRAALTRVHRFELYDDAFDPPFQPWVEVYAQLDRTVAVSEHGRAYLRARGVADERLMLARLGTPPFVRAAASRDGVLRIVSCSFLRDVKRVPLLAQALVELARQRPQQPIAWTHLGDGPTRAEVEAVLGGAPETLRAHLPGTVDAASVREFYAGQPVDLFVQVSASEGLPVSVMEALAAGVPVVATDVGGVAEAVDGAVGTLLPATPDSAAVAAAIAAVALDPDAARRQARRDAAYARWAERFDAAREQARFADWIVRRGDALATIADRLPRPGPPGPRPA